MSQPHDAATVAYFQIVSRCYAYPVIRCLKCSKLKPDHSWLCDCGFEFAGNEPEAKATSQELQPLPNVHASQLRGRRALKFGAIGWLPWLVLLCWPGQPLGSGGGGRGDLLAGFAVLFLLAWGLLFCGIGSVIAYRRTANDCTALKGLWSAALLLNYGFFLCPILFFLFAPIFGFLFSSGSRPLGGP